MKITIKECEECAQKIGFDSATFELHGPMGSKKCTWLDAYMGIFKVEGAKGFSMVSDFERYNVWCENLKAANEAD